MNLIWKTPEEFRNATLGKRIDVDNFPKEQPYQCWDLPAYFWSRVVGRFLATFLFIADFRGEVSSYVA